MNANTVTWLGQNESANCDLYAAWCLFTWLITDTCLTYLRVLPIIDKRLCALRAVRALRAFAPWFSPISALRAFFVLCCVVSIVRYGLRIKNPREATDLDLIPAKFIKFASNIIDSHLYTIVIKDLEENKRNQNSISETHFQKKIKETR